MTDKCTNLPHLGQPTDFGQPRQRQGKRGSRTASSQEIHWYFANDPGPACPAGFGDEGAVRAMWAADAANFEKGATLPSPRSVLWRYHFE